MTEPSIEEIVARVELDLGRPPDAHEPDEAFVGGIIYVGELRALIASWRERGEALEGIVQWSKAYPLNIFPEPDLKRVRSLLEAGGVTLDAVSASAMRHVVEGVGEIAIAALKDKS